LESRLGVRLIDRNARRFNLTEEGALLHERALRIVAEVDDAEAEAGARGGQISGRLRVGAPLQIGREKIAPLIAKFALAHPMVRLELVLTDADLDVADEDLDIMLRLQTPSAPNLVVRRVLAGRRVVCASPDYVKRHGLPAQPEDLRAHNCMTLIRGRRRMDRWLFERDGQRFDVQVRGTLTSTSSDVIHAWTLAGCGVCLKVLWDIEEDLRAGRLIELVPDFACDVSDLYATYAKRQYLPQRTRAFLDFIVTSLQTG
jgi:DNA-binding transcriptional LysR family regulator